MITANLRIFLDIVATYSCAVCGDDWVGLRAKGWRACLKRKTAGDL